jgi:hypothetical protein
MKRHAFDPISFVFGLLFAFLAIFVLAGNTLGDFWPTWALTLPAMTVGLLLVLYAVRRLLPRSSTERAAEVSLDDDGTTGA